MDNMNREHDAIIRRTLMAADPTTRTLTAEERRLLGHVSRFGSAGYPVSKVGSKHWSWSTCPRVFPTKREAVASFEAYYEMLLELKSVEAYRQAIAEGRA